jgi:flagellar biosynthesis protein FlhA
MDPSIAQQMIHGVSRCIETHPEIAGQPVLLTSPTNRRHVYKLISRFIPQVSVISHNELVSDINVSTVGMVEMRHAG